MSSANILLETSRAKTISTPSLLTVFSSVPTLGLTNAMVEKSKKRIRKNNLIFGLKVDLSGLKTFSKFSEIYFFWIFFFHELNSIKPTIIKGIMKSI